MNELTALGKELRKMRIDRQERMLDMAKRLGLTSVSFLSAIETGTKPAPANFVDRLGAAYDLPAEAVENLRRLAIVSANEVRIRMPDEARSRDMVSMFARRVARDDFTDEERDRLLDLLKR